MREPSPITIHARPRANFTSGMHPGDCWQASPGLPSSSFPRARYVCGFGGTFSVKYPDISGAILDAKLNNILDTEASTVLAGDLGCLVQIAGGLSRERAKIEVRHVAEVLAGMTDTPAIAAPPKSR